jgi:hypothetical protein
MGFLLKKRVLIPAIVILLLGTLLYFASDITKNYINKNGKELTGRKIELKELKFNYFDVSVRASEIKIYEDDDSTPFGGLREIFVDFEPWKLLSGEYAFSQVTLDSAWVNIIKRGDSFNFDSLVATDTIANQDTSATAGNLKFLIENINLINGKVDFYDADVNNRIILDNLSLSLPRIAWNNQESNAGIEFMLGETGMVRIGAEADMAKNTYSVDVQTKDVNIDFVKNYLAPYITINTIAGLLDLNLSIAGSMEQLANITITGKAALADFLMTDTDNNTFVKLGKAELLIDTLKLAAESYVFDSLTITRPYIHAELLRGTSNWEKILQPLLADTLAAEGTSNVDETQLHYEIRKIKAVDGEVSFADMTLNRPFSYTLKDLNISIDNLSEKAQQVHTAYSVNLNDQGELTGETTFDMTNIHSLKHKAHIKRMQLQSFSPYSEYYLARGITGGHFNYDFTIDMSRTHLLNNNSVRIQSLDFGQKTGDTTATKLPVRLALYLLKDKDDKIAFDLPVTGNPSDPQFKLGKIIWKTVANFLVKTAASPFNALGALAGDNPDKLKEVEFQFLQDTLAAPQHNITQRIASLHQKKPDLMFIFRHHTDARKEKGLIAIDEATKMMYSQMDSTTKAAAMADAGALPKWIEARVTDTSLTIENACIQIVGKQKVDDIFSAKIKSRNEALQNDLTTKGVGDNWFKIENADFDNITEELKKPHYKVDVELP